MDFIHIGIIDIIDIFAIALLMYYLYKITRGTQAPNILTGIIVIYLLWLVVKALGMEMLSAILGHIIGVGVVALIVVFQPEIRRFLQLLGKTSRQRRSSLLGRLLYFRDDTPGDTSYLPHIVKACSDMSATKTGALIVIQRQMDLSAIVESGITLDAAITAPLLKNIFFKNSPLHDGAVIINNGRIAAAKCVLPSTQSNVPVSFGMRHRAALGTSETTDAAIVVVSEETGTISIARFGQIKMGVAPAALLEQLQQTIESDDEGPAGRRGAAGGATKQGPAV